jgi:hypothetical protein
MCTPAISTISVRVYWYHFHAVVCTCIGAVHIPLDAAWATLFWLGLAATRLHPLLQRMHATSPAHVNTGAAMQDQAKRQVTGATNFNWKVENIAWHPTQPLIVATALNSLYTYCASRTGRQEQQ